MAKLRRKRLTASACYDNLIKVSSPITIEKFWRQKYSTHTSSIAAACYDNLIKSNHHCRLLQKYSTHLIKVSSPIITIEKFFRLLQEYSTHTIENFFRLLQKFSTHTIEKFFLDFYKKYSTHMYQGSQMSLNSIDDFLEEETQDARLCGLYLIPTFISKGKIIKKKYRYVGRCASQWFVFNIY